uniref:Uncharacterized protein n=1 Tax=Lygus hesperus TaxID=30085 RepID=A0A146M3N9_LYGHE
MQYTVCKLNVKILLCLLTPWQRCQHFEVVAAYVVLHAVWLEHLYTLQLLHHNTVRLLRYYLVLNALLQPFSILVPIVTLLPQLLFHNLLLLQQQESTVMLLEGVIHAFHQILLHL